VLKSQLPIHSFLDKVLHVIVPSKWEFPDLYKKTSNRAVRHIDNAPVNDKPATDYCFFYLSYLNISSRYLAKVAETHYPTIPFDTLRREKKAND